MVRSIEGNRPAARRVQDYRSQNGIRAPSDRALDTGGEDVFSRVANIGRMATSVSWIMRVRRKGVFRRKSAPRKSSTLPRQPALQRRCRTE